MRVLLIGGGGYIGNVVAEGLLQNKYKVSILDNFIYGHKKTISNLINFKNFKPIEGDITNINFLKSKVKNYDCVVLLAGLVGDPITKKYPELSLKINDIGVKNAIDISFQNNIKKLIFVSTCSNYGLIKNNDLADENYPLAPISLYAKSKVKAEKYIMNYKNRSINTSATILRFATAFGVSNRMRFDLTVNEFVKDLEQKKELTIYDADTWRPYCHTKDFERLIKIIIESNSNKTSFEIFNVGSDKNNYTKRMIVNEISKFYKNPKIIYLEKGNDPRNYRVNFEKIKKVLNFVPNYSLSDGIVEIRKFIQKGNFNLDKVNFSNYGNYIIKNHETN